MTALSESTSTAKNQTRSEVVSHTGARLFTVQSFEVRHWWPHVEHLIQRWLDEDGRVWTAEGVREELEAARAQLWCFHHGDIKGIWITRIDASDRTTFGLVWGCAGEFTEHKEDAVAFFGIIEDWMRSLGCEFIEICGRDWSRVLTDYQKRGVILRKRL